MNTHQGQSALSYRLTSSPGDDCIYSCLGRSQSSRATCCYWLESEETKGQKQLELEPDFLGPTSFHLYPFCIPPSKIVITLHTSNSGNSHFSERPPGRGSQPLFSSLGRVGARGSRHCGLCLGGRQSWCCDTQGEARC